MQLRSGVRFRSSTVALGLVLAAGLSHAQSNASVVRPHTIEIGPFFGATYGGTGIGSSGETRVMGGGNITYAVTKYILPYFEYSYFPGIPQHQDRTSFGVDYSVALQDFHGGVHIRMPIFREKPFVPYAVIGFGGLRSNEISAAVTAPGLPPFNLTIPSSTSFAVNGGGGIRVYLSQRFGLRGEAKVYKPTGDIDAAFGKVEFGFFFQLN